VIVCDTGPIVAAALGNDDHHHTCVELFTGLHLAGRPMLVRTTDASVIALTERLGLTEVATLDRRHFNIVRPEHAPGLTLLP
jgi:predicted nucleic acid-binding protein